MSSTSQSGLNARRKNEGQGEDGAALIDEGQAQWPAADTIVMRATDFPWHWYVGKVMAISGNAAYACHGTLRLKTAHISLDLSVIDALAREIQILETELACARAQLPLF